MRKPLFIFLVLLLIVSAEIGVIKKNGLIKESKIPNSDTQLAKCKTFSSNSQKKQCWESLIDSSLKDEGINKTFDILESLYKTEPDFANECHGYSHKIGEAAYKLFSTNHKDQTLSSKSFYCGYGYYHGFMETMLHTTGTLDGAREFCKYAGEKLKNQNNDAEGTCYHGIGHGVVDGSDPRSEGNVEEIIRPGLELCQKVAPTERFLNRCSSGVFNSMSIMIGGRRHKLSIDQKNPMWVCSKQSNPIFKMTCYQEMNTLLLGLEKGDFKKAVEWIKDIPEEKIALSAMDSMGQYAANFRKKGSDHTEEIKICQQWPEKLRFACLRGFSVGIILFGAPGEEYKEALAFCQNKLLTDADKDACLERLTWGLYNTYPAEKYKQICQVEEKYMKHCTKYYQ